MFKDLVHVADQGIARLLKKGKALGLRSWYTPSAEKSVVEVEGWVTAILRERGKLVSRRSGKNIWTNTGREFLAMLMSIETGSTAFRSDRIAYIGAGTGAAIEEPGILNLVTPIAYAPGQFLAPVDVPATFPLTPSRTTVRFHRIFAENELTTSPGTQVDVTELGLFTNGSPTSVPIYSPGTRDTGIANAGTQAPCAYKTFDPIGKTDSLELEISWEVRF